MGIVRAVCVFNAQNARRKKGVLSEDIAAILLCTALYHTKKVAMLSMFNKISFKLVFQRFLNAVSKCILHWQNAYSVHIKCRE